MRARPTPSAETAGGDTAAADSGSSSSSGTAEQLATTTAEVPGGSGTQDVATEPAAQPAGHASGDDGRPKRLHVAGLGGELGPCDVGGGVTYTITRAGTVVAGEHVQKVRDIAEHSRVKLFSTDPGGAKPQPDQRDDESTAEQGTTAG